MRTFKETVIDLASDDAVRITSANLPHMEVTVNMQGPEIVIRLGGQHIVLCPTPSHGAVGSLFIPSMLDEHEPLDESGDRHFHIPDRARGPKVASETWDRLSPEQQQNMIEMGLSPDN